MDYLDFELEIAPGSGREYPVAVRSPLGDGRETMHFPFDQLALESRLDKLKLALRSGGKRRRVLSHEEQAVQDFGQALFDALFVGEIRSLYDRSRDRAEREDRGLRVKLHVQAPELAALPWELLYDRRGGEYLVLSRQTPLVRYVELSQPLRPLTVPPPLRILGMVASPKDLDALDIEREKERVERATAELRRRGLVELTWLDGETWRDLQRAMRGGPWHVFHFIGHGGFDPHADEGLIVLSKDDGYGHYLHATQLARLLADQRSLRLVVLNSCEGGKGGAQDIFSSAASILVRRGIPAVLAMQYEITDQAAIELARTFYESLADGLPVDAAVTEARKAISVEVANTVEWCTPVLYMRTTDGLLFDLTAPQVPASQPKQPTETEAARPRSSEPSVGEPPTPPPATTVATPNQLILGPQTRLDLVRVPAGDFLMGSDKSKDPDAYDDELPQHKVYLPEFLIGKHPVTVAQFAAFGEATGYEASARLNRPNKADHPVTWVSWYDARAFCEWASQVTGRSARLPSEAEWEKAARGARGRLLPWGNHLPTERLCNFSENVGDTTPVGHYSPAGDSPYGCSDMAGNVWEWTRSLWGKDPSKPDFAYPYNPYDDREAENIPQAVLRVLRGGSWNNSPRCVRCAYRTRYGPDNYNDTLGFRVVVPLSDSGV